MRSLPGVVILMALVPAAVLCQVPRVGLEVGGIYATLSGNDFQGTNAGIGVDGQVRFGMGGQLSLGLGGQYTSHSVDGINENLNVLGLFAEPRLTLSVPASPLTPFVGVRVGYLRESLSSGGTDATATGYLAGVTGGILYHIGPSINLMAAVIFAKVHLGDATVNGSTFANSSADGTSLGLRAGLHFALGH